MTLVILFGIFIVLILAVILMPVSVDDPEFDIGDIVSRETQDPFESDRKWYHISGKRKDRNGRWWYRCYPCDRDGNHLIHNDDSMCFWGSGTEKTGHREITRKRKGKRK